MEEKVGMESCICQPSIGRPSQEGDSKFETSLGYPERQAKQKLQVDSFNSQHLYKNHTLVTLKRETGVKGGGGVHWETSKNVLYAVLVSKGKTPSFQVQALRNMHAHTHARTGMY